MTSPAQIELLMGLRRAGVTDKKLLEVMEKTPRAHFVSDVFKPRAYEDIALPIGCGQTISQPSVVGIMTQALALNPSHIVMEVGTGSGYQTAILAQLSRRVYSIERHHDLVRQARKNMQALDLHNVSVLAADGSAGMPDQAPFDRIIVTAAAEDPPANLVAQLADEGVMIVPVGQSDATQTVLKIRKLGGKPDYEELCQLRFVPLLEGVAR